MANKVISIKLDEQDIERLKKYYESLKGLGIISNRTLTMNGLYKHLLLDYLERDIREMINTCSQCGLLPRYVSTEEIDEGTASFTNPYNLNEELFADYMQCIREVQCRGIKRIDENITYLNEIANEKIVEFDKTYCSFSIYPHEGEEYDIESMDTFWFEKAVRERELVCEDYQKNSKRDLDLITKASISQDKKQRLIEAIEKFEEDKKKHYAMISGRLS